MPMSWSSHRALASGDPALPMLPFPRALLPATLCCIQRLGPGFASPNRLPHLRGGVHKDALGADILLRSDHIMGCGMLRSDTFRVPRWERRVAGPRMCAGRCRQGPVRGLWPVPVVPQRVSRQIATLSDTGWKTACVSGDSLARGVQRQRDAEEQVRNPRRGGIARTGSSRCCRTSRRGRTRVREQDVPVAPPPQRDRACHGRTPSLDWRRPAL